MARVLAFDRSAPGWLRVFRRPPITASVQVWDMIERIIDRGDVVLRERLLVALERLRFSGGNISDAVVDKRDDSRRTLWITHATGLTYRLVNVPFRELRIDFVHGLLTQAIEQGFASRAITVDGKRGVWQLVLPTGETLTITLTDAVEIVEIIGLDEFERLPPNWTCPAPVNDSGTSQASGRVIPSVNPVA